MLNLPGQVGIGISLCSQPAAMWESSNLLKNPVSICLAFHWRHAKRGRVHGLPTHPWFKNEPNGAKNENCASVASWVNLRWSDFHCATFDGCLCNRLVTHPRLKLQGLCQSSALSKYYSPMNNLTNFASLTFVSMSGLSFEYDAESRRWKLIAPQSIVSGSPKAAHHTFALG